MKSTILLDDSLLLDNSIKLLTREESEGLWLFKADLKLTMLDLNLFEICVDHSAFSIANDWVQDLDEIPRGHSDHGKWSDNDFLMILPNKGLWSLLKASNVLVVVEDVDVLKWFDLDDVLCHC